MTYHLQLLILLMTSLFRTGDNETYLDKRDNNEYLIQTIDDLKWLGENLRYKTSASLCVSADSAVCQACGQSYNVEDALEVCPEGWRLPTENEVKALIRLQKKGRVDIIKDLKIELCGRIDNGKAGKYGEQTTYWIDSELKDGSITHWHIFGNKQELHTHNVVQAKRQFPVRCVCEIAAKD